jgi:hypothetical protein
MDIYSGFYDGWLRTARDWVPTIAWRDQQIADCIWNVLAHAQKPDFAFRRNGLVHLNRLGRQFNRLLASEVCASVVVMLDTSCSQVVWSVLTTHSIRQFPHQVPPSLASTCAFTFQLESNSCCPPAFQELNKQTNTSFVSCSQGFRLKEL